VGGWVFDILQTDKGGAAIWFEESKFIGYGISFGSGIFGIEGTYEFDAKGVMTGSYSLYDFDHVAERGGGSITGKKDKKGTKLTMALHASDGEASSLTMKGRFILNEPPNRENWVAELTGGRKGTLDPLKVEPYEFNDLVYPRFFRISGAGVISDAGAVEMNGYLILTSKKATYGIYEMNGAVSETGIFSGKLDPVSGKLKLKVTSDEGVSYAYKGTAMP
jgi:hypothetical protein